MPSVLGMTDAMDETSSPETERAAIDREASEIVAQIMREMEEVIGILQRPRRRRPGGSDPGAIASERMTPDAA